ncbi:MAG: hypothetical protein Q7S83_00655 [bacterium]|nr:hypothetical protein [bacterium]
MKIRNLANVISFSVAGLVIAGVAFGWTNPSATPPDVGGALKVDSATGNVGINLGTAAPTQKLDVGGYVKGRTGLCIGTGDVVGVDCRTSWPTGTGNVSVVGSGTSGKLTKFTGATTIGNSNLTEGSTGNISIGGTPGSTYKLDVTGKINGTEICIAGVCKTTWPSGLTGSGTTGKIPKWTGASSLGDSSLTESGGITSVGPTNDLSADGNIWGSQSNTSIGPSAAYGTHPWIVPGGVYGAGTGGWELKCPDGQFMIGITQTVNSSNYPGAKILCAKL